ncbi:DUF2283 domain-containing protein [Candidatus Woesearchaeota archaeon]|nr:DUF2283 domain-containing protein [Candidatus Woesearchaeota archaeon]
MKHLEGKGEFLYDYNNDIPLFKTKKRNYLKSLDFDDLIVDIDEQGFITGLQVFDASKVFNLSKMALKHIKEFVMHTKVENKVINIQLHFTSTLRNKPIITHGQNFTRESLDLHLKDAEVRCSV